MYGNIDGYELKELGLWKFAGGIMYIMQEVFGMPTSSESVWKNATWA